MSAAPRTLTDPVPLRFERMGSKNIGAVSAIESAVFPFPWTCGAFASAIAEGNECWVACDASDAVIGYFVLMPVVDEAHLLTIAVRADLQRLGLGRALLDRVMDLAREMKMVSLLLEVRPSNERALDLYERYGFKEIGRRKHYYPAPDGKREDALVMRLVL